MKPTGNKILVVGSGGRDNAIAYLFSKSPRAERVFIAPGNGGSDLYATQVKAKTIEEMADFAENEKIDITFVGPEAPLSAGIVDLFESRGLAIIGPNQKASRLESSKCDTKVLLKELGVPVPEFQNFTEADEAKQYVRNIGYPVVVKADGLAAGKGSLVCDTIEEAEQAIDRLMIQRAFGEAGERVDIEKRLCGRELSFFCFTDGETILPMEAAQDYKRAQENDEGKNTGGMGAYSPYSWLDEKMTQLILEKVARPTIIGLKEKYNLAYTGVIYFGLMLVEEAGEIVPYVLEINVRLGDPEAQVVLPRLQTDLVDICEAILKKTLSKISLRWDPNYFVCLIATSGRTRGKKGWYKGYPDRYKIGLPISGIENVSPQSLLFHSGTERNDDDQLITTGGRVVCLVGNGPTLSEARESTLADMQKITFEGMYFRPDIGVARNDLE